MTAMWDMNEAGSGLRVAAHAETGNAVATACSASSKPRARSARAMNTVTQVTPESLLAGGVPAMRERVQARLAALLPPDDAGVASAMRSGVLSPGKRIRPLMMLTLATDLGCEAPAVLDMACAVEMVHAASLILDDLPCMDDAALRRGKPTVHRQFGEDCATLAAVGLLSLAFRTVAQAPGMHPGPRAQAVVLMADAVGLAGLVGGQYQDLRDGAQARNAEQIALTNHLKTGALFDAAFGLCAVCVQADDAVRGRLAALATELGQAFQLMDDLHDCALLRVDDKDVGLDEHKSTLVHTLGQDTALSRLQAHVAEVERHAQALGARNLGEQLMSVFRPALALHVAPVAG